MVAEVTKHKQNVQNIAIKNGAKTRFLFQIMQCKDKDSCQS